MGRQTKTQVRRVELMDPDTPEGKYSIKRGLTKQERWRRRNPEKVREATRLRMARWRAKQRLEGS